ncbi:sodium ion-translocating decarboxylase subunit beta [Streptococcus plurextorum]|uniref:sodium ion-translocating decarboxylase subunit beta n=1 Tax=Streptococcus plurextorum TaxID=456876 RepID=UPI0004270331|nr:sodium ion-translocating decarboxylase subunit beta [Streptococcus plurextorum]
MLDVINQMIETSGFANLSWQHLVMIALALVFLYLGIKKEYEPYLMVPIAFGILLVNLPLGGLMVAPQDGNPGGLLYYLYQGTNLGIYPPLIFLCLGASTDFGPLIANPKTILLGGAAQLGIFVAFFLAILFGMTPQEAASVGIIGGADGPTAIYVTTRLAPDLLATIALAAYSYMALVPIIQPPIIRALTTEEERKTKMVQARPVSQTEKIIFPIVVTIFVSLMVPSATTLVGCLMLGNLVREIKIVPKIMENLQNTLMYCVTIILGLTVGAKANAELFLSVTTLKIIALGLLAFAFGTAGGVLLGKLMYRLSGKKINPMIGAAGVSAVPMAARVVQKVGQEEDPSNFLLMHAMGPNVAGVIGSAIAAGALLAFFG